MGFVFRICCGCLICATLFSITGSGQQSGQKLHLIRFVAPAYPALARTGRIQGKVAAELHVNADGTLASSVVTMSHPVFRRYVEKALSEWRFEPLSEPATLDVVVDFKIGDCPHASSEASLRETRVTADLPGHVEVGTCADAITTTVN